MKLLTDESLPNNEDDFFELLDVWFPKVYDVKVMLKATKIRRTGLQELADELGVRLPSQTFARTLMLIQFPGIADRPLSPSWLRLPSHLQHILQTPRLTFPQSH
jgi:hypothetical protein